MQSSQAAQQEFLIDDFYWVIHILINQILMGVEWGQYPLYFMIPETQDIFQSSLAQVERCKGSLQFPLAVPPVFLVHSGISAVLTLREFMDVRRAKHSTKS